MNVLGFQKELLAEEFRICGLFSPARNSAHNKKKHCCKSRFAWGGRTTLLALPIWIL